MTAVIVFMLNYYERWEYMNKWLIFKSQIIYSQSSITIHWSQNSVLTCSKLKPNKVWVESIFRDHMVNSSNKEEIDKVGISFHSLLQRLQISSAELESVIDSLCPLKIDKKYYRMDDSYMFDIGSKLVILYVDSELKSRKLVTLQSFIDVNAEKQALDEDLFTGYGLNILINILSHIFDLKHEDDNLVDSVFEKNINKVKVFWGRSLLKEKDSYFVGEFLELITTTFDIVLEEDALKDFEANNKALVPKNNIIEGLPSVDLNFLKHHAIIVFKESVIDKDHTIQLIDYYSLGSTIKERINSLDSIKTKWTKSELQTFCGEFLDDYKNDFNVFLSKEFKIIKERNPFDVEKEILFYIKKY